MTRHVLVVYGTRPEAIKMAPVIHAIAQQPEMLRLTVCSTGQHREMLRQVEEIFDLRPDVDLGLMRPRQQLNDLAARGLSQIDELLADLEPDWVLVQGDTTTAMVTALAAFHRRVSVGHVEAGLRTGDLEQPFPEEANRRIIDVFAHALFAPTAHAAARLRAEGIDESRILLTGNTVVDALHRVSDLTEPAGDQDLVFITLHRRESFGEPIRGVMTAIRRLAESFPAVRWVYPVHRNPEVREPAHEILGGVENVELHDPFDYLTTIRNLRACRLVLTDSGGLQEEAPTFGKPILVARDTTERPEGVEAGVARLVGTDPERVFGAVARLLEEPAACEEMSRVGNPYGDGHAAERIAAFLAEEPWKPFEAGGPAELR
jgi:UDP-N-acetylglucosamine 2-epimerase